MSIAIMENGTPRLVEGDEEAAALRALLVEARVRVAEVERENRDLRKRLGAARLGLSNLLMGIGCVAEAEAQRELMVEEVAA